MFPVHEVHGLVRPACRHLHLHPVAQKLVGAQAGLVERDASGVGGHLKLLERGGNVGRRVAAGREVLAKK